MAIVVVAGRKGGMTSVAFELEDAAGGTLVTVSETGFEAISERHCAKAFQENSGGWDFQMANLESFLATH